VFHRCLVSQDVVVQRELIEGTDLSPEQLEQLAGQGASRAVRNMAQVRLRQSTSKLRARSRPSEPVPEQEER
jgi:hypothetical protein